MSKSKKNNKPKNLFIYDDFEAFMLDFVAWMTSIDVDDRLIKGGINLSQSTKDDKGAVLSFKFVTCNGGVVTYELRPKKPFESGNISFDNGIESEREHRGRAIENHLVDTGEDSIMLHRLEKAGANFTGYGNSSSDSSSDPVEELKNYYREKDAQEEMERLRSENSRLRGGYNTLVDNLNRVGRALGEGSRYSHI